MRVQRKSINGIKRRSVSKEIVSKLNILPIKSLLFAISFLLSKIDKAESEELQLNVTKTKRSIKQITTTINKLKLGDEIDPQEFGNIIDSAVSSYINLYYSLDNNMRNAITKEYGHYMGKSESLGRDENILVLPLKMFKKRYTKNNAITLTRKGLYKKPFKYLSDAMEASRRVESMQMKIGLKPQSDFGISKIYGHIKMIEKRILDIERSIINPEIDERLKNEIIEELAGLSATHKIHTITYINSKLDEGSLSSSSASRMLRG